MEYFIAWTMIGALVGYAIASHRGWSGTAGALSGALLGILSPLLLVVSGPPTKVCPQCAEQVKAAAKLCRFCGSKFDADPVAPPEKAAVPNDPPKRAAMSKWQFECADRQSGAESVETVVALNEVEALKIAAERGKSVVRIVSVTKLAR